MTLTGAGATRGRSRILIVEDDPAVSRMVKTYLERAGYQVVTAALVAEMRHVVESGSADLVLLDLVLPDEDGWSALRWVRGRGELPVIMMTGCVDPADKVVGLELGADDYLVKPFDLRELLARIRSVQRRVRTPGVAAASTPVVRFDGWALDRHRHALTAADGATVHLSELEYRVLALLAAHPRQVVSRDSLMRAATGREWAPSDRAIDVHISNLRRKLTGAGSASPIRTVRGAGYMLIVDE